MLFRKSSCDWMIVGLGNPGTEYTHTRHNVGFRVTDLLAGQLRVKIDRLKMKALTRFVDWKGSRILLVQPQTYMNLSGAAVSALASYYKIPPERILVRGMSMGMTGCTTALRPSFREPAMTVERAEKPTRMS